MTQNQNDKQDHEIDLFTKQYSKKIGNEDLEQFMYDAAELGKKLELKKIQNQLVGDCMMNTIDFSDPKNMQYLLPLLPEFIFYCSNPNTEESDTVEAKKTIPMNNFNALLYKIIDNRETDSIDDILNEIVSLIFVLDEQNEGTSACGSAMKFVYSLIKERSEFQFEVVLGIRLMAILINTRYVPEKNILKILNPARFHEPYIRKNQYIAIKEILSRAGTQNSNSDFRKIPYDHKIFEEIIMGFLNKVSLYNSYEKLKKIDELNQNSAKASDQDDVIEIKKWNNIIITERKSGTITKVEKIYEFDQWVQCQFIFLLPYVYEIIEKNKKLKIKSNYLIPNKFPNLEKLSWNVQFSFLTMIRSSKKVLVESGKILAELFYRSTPNSDFQTACILAIIEFFKENEERNKLEGGKNISKEEELLKCIHQDEKGAQRRFCYFLTNEAEVNVNSINDIIKANGIEDQKGKFEKQLNYILKIIPIFSSLLRYYSKDIKKNHNNLDKIFKIMNILPINGRPICCRVFLDPFFISMPYIDKDTIGNDSNVLNIYTKIEESFKIAQNALQILLNSEDDFDDRLFYIKMVNYFYESENERFRAKSILMLMPLLDLISNDPVYIVRDYAVQTVLKLLASSTFPDVLDYIQQIFPSSSLNGKKSLLSLIASMILSIDPFESQEAKDSLFEDYIDQIFLVIKENKNKDLKRFFRDMLKSIWTFLPESTQVQFLDLFPEEISNKKDEK